MRDRVSASSAVARRMVGADIGGLGYDSVFDGQDYPDRQLVDHRLACELDARDQPPHRGMEPEDGAQDFLGDQPRPVAPGDVMELVRDHGALRTELDRLERNGEQDHRPQHAERHRMPDLR